MSLQIGQKCKLVKCVNWSKCQCKLNQMALKIESKVILNWIKCHCKLNQMSLKIDSIVIVIN